MVSSQVGTWKGLLRHLEKGPAHDYLHMPAVLDVPRTDNDACMERASGSVGNANRLMHSNAFVMVRTTDNVSIFGPTPLYP